MSKKDKRDRKAKRATAGRRKHSKIWPISIVILGVGLVVALVFFFPRSEPWGLPAIPRIPRPATLSPELFTGKVAQVYRIAREAPALLEQMPCYWLLCERSAPEQLGLLYGSSQRRLKDLPRHYAGCVCDVQKRSESRGYKKGNRRKVFQILAV